MKRLIFLAIPLATAFSMQAVAQEDVQGSVQLAWREVSVSGSQNKYRQFLNLDDGPRLQALQFNYRPANSRHPAPDEIDIELHNLGGEPFESMHFGARKYGAYRFRYDRRESRYFYDDLLIDPGSANASGSTGGDFHRFDIERVQDKVSLDLHLTSRAQANLGFERFTRLGNAVTTRDVQRDEFELDQPVDEESRILNAGFQYRWDTVTAVVEQKFREYENFTEIFLPGFSVGANAGQDPTTLDFFVFEQPYGYDSAETTLKLIGRPNGPFAWHISASNMQLDLEFQTAESAEGVDFQGNPFVADITGAGDSKRDARMYIVGGNYAFTDKVSVVAEFRQQRLDQRAAQTFGNETGGSDWDIDTERMKLGIEFRWADGLLFTAGWNAERRDTTLQKLVEGSSSTVFSDTDRDGLFAAVQYRPSKRLELRAQVEDNDLDDPFAVSSATDAVLYKLRGRYRFSNGALLTAVHKTEDLENSISGWQAKNEQSDLRLSVRNERLSLALGASVIERSRSVTQRVTGGGRQDLFPISYRADTRFLSGLVDYKATESVSLGANLRHYDNDGNFPTDRQDLEVFLIYDFPQSYRMRWSYRTVDYNEDLEDFDTDIFEVAFGIRW